MTEIEHFSRALKYINQYEEYRFTKAWGIMMIVVGASSFVTGILNQILYQFLHDSIRDPFSFIRNMKKFQIIENLIYLITYCPIILSFFIALYMFFTVKRTRITDTNEIRFQKYAYFGLALFLMSFLPFLALTLFLVDYPIFSLIGVLSSYLSYLLLKRVQKSTDFRELMYLSGVLIVFTLPGVATSLIEIWMNQRWILWDFFSSIGTTPEILKRLFDFSQLSYFCVFSIGCIVSGYYSIQNGFKILKDDTRIQE